MAVRLFAHRPSPTTTRATEWGTQLPRRLATGETGGDFADIQVPGYTNPKYVVLGVIYAPPQPSSSESYASASLESTTHTLSSSYLSSYTYKVTTSLSLDIAPYKNSALDLSASQSDETTQSTESTTTGSITVTKGSTVIDTWNGPNCPYVGVDHDYDVIKLWLNPVRLFTLKNNGVVEWDGYGYSSLDTIANGGDLRVPNMDIQWVYVGCLNGDFNK